MHDKPKEYWIKKLDLSAHPEGGFYKQTFKSENIVKSLGEVENFRSAGTNIYFLMGSPAIGDFSAWHRLNNLEETWHHYYGKDVTLYIIDSYGNLIEKHLGHGDNAQLQVHVPASVWFCAVVNSLNIDDYALVGCTVHPGFDFKDFELADRQKLSQAFPRHKDIIEKFTRVDVKKEKKIDLDWVVHLSAEEILQISLTALKTFNTVKKLTLSALYKEPDAPAKLLKKKLKSISSNPPENLYITSMIEAIEMSDIDLDTFMKIKADLKAKNSRKGISDNAVTFNNM